MTDALVPRKPPGDLRREYLMGQIPETEQYRMHWGRSLDLSRIDAAIRAANIGLMYQLTDMGRESLSLSAHVSSLLQKRLNRIGALDWEVQAASGRMRDGKTIDPVRAEERAAQVRENLQQIPNFRDRVIDIAWGNFDGRSGSELEWIGRPGQWAVRNAHWIHPRRLSFGPDRDIRVLDPMRQTGNFYDVGLPIEQIPFKFITFRPRLFGDYQEREGLGPRVVYWTWFERFAVREQLELMEIFGKPWRIMKPQIGSPQMPLVNGNRDAYETAYLALKMLSGNSVARMPPGVDVQVVQPEKGAGEVHENVKADSRSVLTKMFLGGVATTEAVSTGIGSSLADVHATEEDLIIAVDAMRISECLEDMLTDPIILANYGPLEAPYAPRFLLRTDPPKDREKEGTRIKLALEVGLRVAEKEARERLGFREVQDDEAYLVRIQRTVEPGQVPPAPAFETVYPVGQAPPMGEIPDDPDVALNAPEGAAPGAAPGAPPDVDLPLDPNAPADPALPVAATDEPLEPSASERLAARMNELGATECAHKRKNRCPLCGIERHWDPELDASGTVVWPVVWKTIGANAPAAEPDAADDDTPIAPNPAQTPAQTAPTEPFDPTGDEALDDGMGGLDDEPAREPVASDDDLEDDDDPFGEDEDDQPTMTARRALRVTARTLLGQVHLQLAAGSLPSEGGNHWHGLVRADHQTAIDGQHSHWFQLPDDTLVQTLLGGMHGHRWPKRENDDGGPRYIFGGAHLHRIELEGAELRTEVDGYHDHELQVSSTTQSGRHCHHLVLTDGATIESLDSFELVELLENSGEGNPISYAERQGRLLSGIVGALIETTEPVLFAAQPETVYGTPDDLVSRGVTGFAPLSLACGEFILARTEGKTTGRAIRKAIDAGAAAWDTTEMQASLERELAHGQWLGALDAEWEAENNQKIEVESFTDLWREGVRLLAEKKDPGADPDPAFSKRPQMDAGQAFIEKEVVTRPVFDSMTKAAQRRAFTVANAATKEIARTVKRELVRQIAQGADLADFKRAGLARLRRAGWTPANPSHVETVFRTNVLGAYNSGRHRQMTQPAVLELRPYWQVLGVGDGPPRERPKHAEVNNKVFSAKDPGWQRKYPPFGYNCRHRVRSLSKAQAERLGIHTWSEFPGLPDPGFTSGVGRLLTDSDDPPEASRIGKFARVIEALAEVDEGALAQALRDVSE